MKKMKRILFSILLLFIPFFSFAGSWEQSPGWVVDDLKSSVQDTNLQNQIPWQWVWITDSLEWVKKWSWWYLQWLAYIWLSAALLLIIYNWILILANFWEENKLSKAKKRFMSLIIWVVLVTSAYVIIKLVVSFVWSIF